MAETASEIWSLAVNARNRKGVILTVGIGRSVKKPWSRVFVKVITWDAAQGRLTTIRFLGRILLRGIKCLVLLDTV
jgi:hypothetical protein